MFMMLAGWTVYTVSVQHLHSQCEAFTLHTFQVQLSVLISFCIREHFYNACTIRWIFVAHKMVSNRVQAILWGNWLEWNDFSSCQMLQPLNCVSKIISYYFFRLSLSLTPFSSKSNNLCRTNQLDCCNRFIINLHNDIDANSAQFQMNSSMNRTIRIESTHRCNNNIVIHLILERRLTFQWAVIQFHEI